MNPADVLVLGPHPDDAEIACGGTILKLTDRGVGVVVADMTHGEAATRGTPELRHAECQAASAALGLRDRVNLGLPDAAVRDDLPAVRAVVGVLRAVRPRLLLVPEDRDLHPDHEATGAVGRRAFFLAGLRTVHPDLGPPHRPALLLHYPLHFDPPPTLCVDIGAVADRKLRAISCYRSQIGGDDRSHLARLDPLERARARDLHYGAAIGRAAAEPFRCEGPVPVDDLMVLLAR